MILAALLPVLQQLVDVMQAVLVFYHGLIGSWGLSIILVTATVRLAILPLTFRGVKGMQEMQRLQPEMKKIQERYKEDKQRQQQETMKLYQEHGVNPLSSCLPLLLQCPFFIALYFTLRGSSDQPGLKGDICPGIAQYSSGQHLELTNVTCTQFGAATHHIYDTGFLFIPDLTAKATGIVLITLIVLYVASQLGASLVSTVSADRNQRLLFMALPVVFVPVIIGFPAGLIVYWITTNLWTLGQQLVVRRLYPKPPPLDLSDPGSKPARGKPPEAAAADGKGGSADKPTATTGNGAKAGPSKAPPQNPRKRKKRSGRRR